MKAFKTIKLKIENNVCTIWLNRPDIQNAVSNEMLRELKECYASLETDENVRLVVLRGNGKSFSAGADLKEMLNAQELSFDENLDNAYLWTGCLKTIYEFSKPTIGVATGNIFGGGNGLLGCNDIVIANTEALFSFPEVRIGLAPSTILPYILNRVNEHKVKYLMLTGERFGAFDAREYGLVDVVKSTEEVEEELKRVISSLLKASPNGVSECKTLVGKIKGKPIDGEIENVTASSIAKLKLSEEAFEGIKAFKEKRPAYWVPGKTN